MVKTIVGASVIGLVGFNYFPITTVILFGIGAVGYAAMAYLAWVDNNPGRFCLL